jgi:hypothetical protein
MCVPKSYSLLSRLHSLRGTRDDHHKASELRKTKSGQALSKTKFPKFEKKLTFLVPYIFEEK